MGSLCCKKKGLNIDYWFSGMGMHTVIMKLCMATLAIDLAASHNLPECLYASA